MVCNKFLFLFSEVSEGHRCPSLTSLNLTWKNIQRVFRKKKSTWSILDQVLVGMEPHAHQTKKTVHQKNDKIRKFLFLKEDFVNMPPTPF